MASAREMRLRIRSVKNIGQVTRALQAVSASKVRRAVQAFDATTPYAEKAWKVLLHLARQSGRSSLHPLLKERDRLDKVLVVMITSDRGLAGASNVNVVRKTLEYFKDYDVPVGFVPVGRKGRDLLYRGRLDVMAEFSHLPSPPSFLDVSAIGRLVLEDYLEDKVDRVYLAYNEYRNMIYQTPVIRQLLPLDLVQKEAEEDLRQDKAKNITGKSEAVFIYEPDQEEILGEIVERFTAIQVYQAILSAQASEHAARMVAMRNATDNAADLASALQLEYNKARQQTITNDLLDIVGAVVAMESN